MRYYPAILALVTRLKSGGRLKPNFRTGHKNILLDQGIIGLDSF